MNFGTLLVFGHLQKFIFARPHVNPLSADDLINLLENYNCSSAVAICKNYCDTGVKFGQFSHELKFSMDNSREATVYVTLNNSQISLKLACPFMPNINGTGTHIRGLLFWVFQQSCATVDIDIYFGKIIRRLQTLTTSLQIFEKEPLLTK